ncbi:haloacid dehalogenase-like hydrolase (HAD) superfamily protein isoform X2 [Tasmannia lanceolata]|uniref:haloacid dehalogenase-like hydrolase (HAD) superfamily protein isoform X2 n=1 Tax=Tasmannia lanceolata TaxID=3420 RepID=UPI004063F58F
MKSYPYPCGRAGISYPYLPGLPVCQVYPKAALDRCFCESLNLSLSLSMECNFRCSSLFPPIPSSSLRVSSLPAILKLPAIGAEYGEGFETFRLDGPLKVDVDFLNDRMQESFLQRIRYAMKPDEAFGLIFSWDNVVADTGSLKLNAWRQLADEEGKDIPINGATQRSMLYAGADHVLHKVLCWESEESKLERLKSRLSQLYFENLLKLKAPVEGLKEWLDAVYTAGIPCALASSLDRTNLLGALHQMGLKKYFQAVVTEEDGMESIAHRFLSAAVKLDRKPSKCVVFEDDPRGITAAHNCTMMAVALIGAYPAYELEQADLAVASFSELSVINLRRLFAHKGSGFMDLQKQIIEKAPLKRKLTIDTFF